MSRHPEVLWAQRSNGTVPEKNVVFLTVNLPNIDGSSLEYALTSTSLSFKAAAATNAERVQYAFDFQFFAEVDTEKSTKRLTSRDLKVVLRKKVPQSEYWPRLTKEKIRTPFVKTDFERWVDEDEQDGNPDPVDDFDGVGNFPGMPDMPDFSKMMSDEDLGGSPVPPANNDVDSDSDSDSDGPPPLEDAEPPK